MPYREKLASEAHGAEKGPVKVEIRGHRGGMARYGCAGVGAGGRAPGVAMKLPNPRAPLWRRLLAAAALALCVAVAFAGELRSSDGRIVGRLDYGGELRDASGRLLLRFEPDGAVRDSSGRKLFALEPSGQLRGASGSLLGTVEPGGDVREASGRLLGRVESDGDVRASSGRLIGTAREVRRAWAAVYFFFL